MAKSKKLAYSVTLWNTESASYETFLPGMELPGWAGGMVKNERAFQDEETQPAAGVEGDGGMVVPGPSQLPYHTEESLVTKNRMMTGTGVPRGSGTPMKQDAVRADTVNPQPNLHDEVAKAANRAVWTTDAREVAFKLRQGLIPSEQDKANAEHLVEDHEMNLKAEEQQKEMAAQLAAQAYDEAMAVQAQAAVQSATAMASVPGASDVLDARKDAAKKATASKKTEPKSESK